MIEIRFFDRMRGALMAAPTSDDPVRKIPHAAPKTERPKDMDTPNDPHEKGEISAKIPPQDVWDIFFRSASSAGTQVKVKKNTCGLSSLCPFLHKGLQRLRAQSRKVLE
mmetsp:Transcript_49205/g.96992  ORF Transcript_49205/g.96992 Transcript_49205/m.96992 type:complete len:109 (+) Transcript_49205:574-900(+)